MSVRHDPLLARALAREIRAGWSGARVDGLALDPERRAAELRFRRAPTLRFLLHPRAGHILAGGKGVAGDAEAREGRGEDSATEDAARPPPTHPFRRLFLGAVEAPPDERLLLLPLVDARGRDRHVVAVELHTNQMNLLLLDALPDGTRRVRAALWPRSTARRELRPGADYRPPPGGRRWVAAPPEAEAWAGLLAAVPGERRRKTLLREAAWTSSVNVAWILGPADDAGDERGSATGAEAGDMEARAADEAGGAAELEAARLRYVALRAAAAAGDGGAAAGGGGAGGAGGRAWLLDRPWGPQPYPAALEERGARPAASLLEAMARAAATEGSEVERWLPRPETPTRAAGEAAERARLRQALEARRRRLRRRLAALRRELESGEDAEALREVGHLLLARLAEIPRGAARVELEGFDGSPREVALDPTLSPAENAEAYFERAARRERARERVPRAEARARQSLEAVERALERLEEEGPSEPLWEAAGGRPAGRGRGEGEDGEGRRPYLRYRTSGGHEIRVGRGARHNDALTFHHSSPEDIWLHARQVPGAHVILRWGRRDQNPPRRDLQEAALAAAVHSGARHSGTVAVDWTRRKYVRKPRKSPPGAVLPERVQTLFVQPNEEVLERLREDD